MLFRCGPRGLTSGQSELLERVQKHVLRNLLPEAKYSEALAATGLATLEQRRVELCRRFASGLRESPEFCDWLPSRELSGLIAIYEARTNWPLCKPEHRDSCVAQLHTSQTCSANSLSSTLSCLSLYKHCFLSNVCFYTLYTTFIQPSAAQLFLVKMNHYYYSYYYYLAGSPATLNSITMSVHYWHLGYRHKIWHLCHSCEEYCREWSTRISLFYMWGHHCRS